MMLNISNYTVAPFRKSALALLGMALPFLGLWLLEGRLLVVLSGFRDTSAEAVLATQIAAHRISGWLLPLALGPVFAYGITCTEPDARLVAMGCRDPRRVWLQRWLPLALVCLGGAVGTGVLMSQYGQEPVLRLVSASVAATAFTLAVGFAVAVLTNATPGVAALATLVIGGGVTLLPPRLGLAPVWSLSPGPLGWLRGAPFAPVFLLHSAVVLASALAIVLVALFIPRDVRRIHWIAHFRGAYD